MSDCLFCKFVSGTIKTDVVYEDKEILAFKDINPQAPLHILIIPKKHVTTLNELQEEDAMLMGQLVLVAGKIAKQLGVDKSGYRLVFNCNRDAGQAVFHIHGHLLAGRLFAWPPG